eukprot:1983979-Pleurochrysis_carterae.AAC.1
MMNPHAHACTYALAGACDARRPYARRRAPACRTLSRTFARGTFACCTAARYSTLSCIMLPCQRVRMRRLTPQAAPLCAHAQRRMLLH